jgi:hypothetical protein
MKVLGVSIVGVCGALLGVASSKVWHLYVRHMQGHALNYVWYAASDLRERSNPLPAERSWPTSKDEVLLRSTYKYDLFIPSAAFEDLVYVSNGEDFIAFYPYVYENQRVVMSTPGAGIAGDMRMPTGRAFVMANRIKPF